MRQSWGGFSRLSMMVLSLYLVVPLGKLQASEEKQTKEREHVEQMREKREQHFQQMMQKKQKHLNEGMSEPKP